MPLNRSMPVFHLNGEMPAWHTLRYTSQIVMIYRLISIIIVRTS